MHKLTRKLISQSKGKTSKYATHRGNHLILPNVRNNYEKRNITLRGAQMYNKLPANVKESSSLKIFKKKLLIYIHKNETF